MLQRIFLILACLGLGVVPVWAQQPVDTELPAAVTLGDTTANPTVPGVAAFSMCWNGTTWDRCPGTAADGLLVNLGANNDVTNAGLTELAAAINSNLVDVNIVSGAGSGGTAIADDADFVAGTTSFTPVGGFFQSTVTPCTDGDACTAGVTAQKAWKVTLYDEAGSGLVLAEDAVTGEPVPGGGPLLALEYAAFDGVAFPGAVDVEGDAVIPKASAEGVPYVALMSPNGALNYGTTTTPLVVDLGANNDVTVTGTITANLSAVDNAVLDDIADGIAVTNAGTFAVQSTPGTAANWGLYLEDAPETAGANLMMAGAVRRDTAASSAGTPGENATFNVDGLGRLWMRPGAPCQDHARIVTAPITSAASGNVEIVALNGSDLIYVCGYEFTSTTAQGIQWIYGTGTACATGETDISGVMEIGATGGIARANAGAPQIVVPAGNAFCVEKDDTIQMSGYVTYVRTAAP